MKSHFSISMRLLFMKTLLTVFSLIMISFTCLADNYIVTVKGRLLYYNTQYKISQPISGFKVEIWDSDVDGPFSSYIIDDKMGTTVTDANGNFQITCSGGDPLNFSFSRPDVYIKLILSDPSGLVRLTDELNFVQNYVIGLHQHDNVEGLVDFGNYTIDLNAPDNYGTKMMVYMGAYSAWKDFYDNAGLPPSGYYDIEYWYNWPYGTPWTNLNTTHWPTGKRAYFDPNANCWRPSFHEFGHAVRHSYDGDQSHWDWDDTRFIYARVHHCDEKESSPSSDVLKGFAFNEGWAHFWQNNVWCGTPGFDDMEVEGNVANALNNLSLALPHQKWDMIKVLKANPGTIHSFQEFKEKALLMFPRLVATTSPQVGNLQAEINDLSTDKLRTKINVASLSKYKEKLSTMLISARANLDRTDFSCTEADCEKIFNDVLAPHLLNAEIQLCDLATNYLLSNQKAIDSAKLTIENGTFDKWHRERKQAYLESCIKAIYTNIFQALPRVRKLAEQYKSYIPFVQDFERKIYALTPLKEINIRNVPSNLNPQLPYDNVFQKTNENSPSDPVSDTQAEPTDLLTTNFVNITIPAKDNCTPSQKSKWPSCFCNNGTFPFSTDYEWAPISEGDFLEFDTYGLSGKTIKQELSTDDLILAHPFGFNPANPQNVLFKDWESFIVPDQQYTNLLSSSNDGKMFVEQDQGLIPEEFRSAEGDRTAIFGRLIADCGHDDYHTEIHPPLILVNARPAENMSSKKLINPTWSIPANQKNTTYTSIISRPFLVLEKYNAIGYGDVTFKEGILRELAGTYFLPGYQLSLTPTVVSTPFQGTKVISYDVFPVATKTNPSDQLSVQFHFTCRSGVAVQVLNKNDHITVLIVMSSYNYNQDPLKESKNFLKPHQWTLQEDKVKELYEQYYSIPGGAITVASVFGQFQVAQTIAKGMILTGYENPVPASNFDKNIFHLNSSGQQFDISDDQPFPIYGWMAVGWVSPLKPTDIPYISPCATNYDPKTSYRPIKIESLDGSTEFSINNSNKAFRITNTGTGIVKITRIRLAGNNSGSFKMKIPILIATNGEIVLAPGESSDFTVIYGPGGEGYSEATIEVITDIFKECPYKLPISGMVIR